METPTLDALARAGTRFTRAYSECPICIPARRSLMTGATPRRHGDRTFQPALPMPDDLETLPAALRSEGWQAQAVGKLHVYPPRDRIGFEEAWIAEEGRPQLGAVDDHDLFLADRGQAGEQFAHGMSNNDYGWRPWHLAEDLHVTAWAARETCRAIKRRDPTRPGFWYLSFTHPHPPLVPPASYLERYARRDPPPPAQGVWSAGPLPPALRWVRSRWPQLPRAELDDARRAFFALCTHIDAQLRRVIGTLREEKLLDDTAILVTSDHGDMLGDHGLFAKRLMYEMSAQVPMILIGPKDGRVPAGAVDDRLVGLADVMPTLLDLAGVAPPADVEGLSMIGGRRRETLYCEAMEGPRATRMVTDGRWKLIWYPDGAVVQLFDTIEDPAETHDRAADPDCAPHRVRLERVMAGALYGGDEAMAEDGRLIGKSDSGAAFAPGRDLLGQRGLHYPPPPLDDPSVVIGG